MFRYNRSNSTKDVFSMAKHLDPEYKEYLCRLVVDEGRKVSELARELDQAPGSLYKWTRAYRKQKEAGQPASQTEEPKVAYKTPKDLENEIKQLQKQLARKEEENDILKKAMHVFTKVQE